MIKHTHAYTHTHTSKDKQLFFYSKQLFSFACLFVSIVLSLSRFSIRILRSQKNNPEMKAQESMLIFNYG